MSSTTLKNDRTMGPKIAEQVCYALYSTSGAVTQAYASLLSPFQLTYSQFVVMMGLWQQDAVSVTELGRFIGLSKATLTPMLKTLENRGYLQRNRVPGNERTMAITLTRQGRDFARQAEQVAEQALCATGLTKEEAAQLIALCDKVKRRLNSDKE
ncbi:MarR family transcriptional regulator [Methylophaga sp.]|jgi:DNA-binding MarR family transcriptional regulator|uniref:MarR family winged helix-turn-helix transcriptional regulator n=1 Tax=Methylophaga sp. TaxID=2024840 RepID=UPI0025E57E11|nr:MarR family transcriptional regulator [Methylophaga sp.]